MSTLLRIAATAVLGVALFVAGVLVGGHPEATGLTNLPESWRKVVLGSSGTSLPDQVLEVLRGSYYRDVDADRLGRRSVDEMVKALDDPYTYYLSPDDLVAFRASLDGSYYGVGLQVAQRDRDVVITGVFDDSPARRAGIRQGDRIVSVDGVTTVGLALDVVVAKIKGPRDSTVRLGLARAGRAEPVVHELKREKITVPVVTSRVEARGGRRVGYVRLAQFTRGAAGGVRAAVRKLAGGKGVTSIVLDLRGDPGGLVDEAVGVTSVFVRTGTAVVRTQGRHRDPETLRTTEAPASSTTPLLVLVDRNSASASEIVAGALRDAGRARLVGENTFGKALVQTTIRLRDGGALKLTTASYVTPAGVNLARRGLRPDVRIADRPATPADEALERALSLAAAAGRR